VVLPSNVSFGTVTGAFLRAVADSPTDSDRDPEGLPVADLSVRFTASISPAIVRDTSATPPVTILIDPITAVVDSSGILVGPDGQPGVRLVASTDPDIQPTGWTWTVGISSPTFPSLSFSFTLDAGQTIDLASVVQVPSNPGTTLDAWLAAVSAARAAQAAAEAAATRAEAVSIRSQVLTQAQYDALTPPNASTLYLITT
jgi:hypothetical protein